MRVAKNKNNLKSRAKSYFDIHIYIDTYNITLNTKYRSKYDIIYKVIFYLCIKRHFFFLEIEIRNAVIIVYMEGHQNKNDNLY